MFLELCEVIKKSFTPSPDVEIMKYQFDVKDWLKNVAIPVHNIVYPHCFKFLKSEGNVIMKYKNWCNDDVWLPDETGGISLLQVSLFIH